MLRSLSNGIHGYAPECYFRKFRGEQQQIYRWEFLENERKSIVRGFFEIFPQNLHLTQNFRDSFSYVSRFILFLHQMFFGFLNFSDF